MLCRTRIRVCVCMCVCVRVRVCVCVCEESVGREKRMACKGVREMLRQVMSTDVVMERVHLPCAPGPPLMGCMH